MIVTNLKYLGRTVKEVHSFKVDGTFQSMYAAQRWCTENGYSYGSSSAMHKEVAMVKGEYNLPQKWKNFDKHDKASIDGVMLSNDRREGTVEIYIF